MQTMERRTREENRREYGSRGKGSIRSEEENKRKDVNRKTKMTKRKKARNDRNMCLVTISKGYNIHNIVVGDDNNNNYNTAKARPIEYHRD